jgi:hypothetical protein
MVNTIDLSSPELFQGQRSDFWPELFSEELDNPLSRDGYVLVRGYKDTHEELSEQISKALGRPAVEYIYRSTPRTSRSSGFYSSTEYPSRYKIELHSECAYTNNWPQFVIFWCSVAPSKGMGATIFGDNKLVYDAISPEISREFEERGLTYIRNYGGMDLPWTEVFQTKDRQDVEKYCHSNGLSYTWGEQDSLQTRQTRHAVEHCTKTGHKLWFNQAHLFHPASLEAKMRKGLVSVFGEEGLPRNVLFGDGTRIPDSYILHIMEAYNTVETRFDWERGDTLILDNHRVCHGREPFTGSREILVGMF